jgi:hypothetical protein
VIGGIIVGFAQTSALRHVLSRPFVWVAVTAGAWCLGFQLGLAWLTVDGIATNPLAEHATVFGTAGLMIGVITGVALRLLVADTLAVSNTLPHPTLPRRGSKLKLSPMILIFLCVVVIAVVVVFTGMMLGML